MTCHYPDLGCACDWLSRGGNLLRPIRSTTQIWALTLHQYGISALVPQTSFRGETSWWWLLEMPAVFSGSLTPSFYHPTYHVELLFQGDGKEN